MTLSIESGLDFILLHIEEPIFPRRIATYATEGKQILVNTRGEALARFKQSNLLDCRMSAYPYPVPEYKGVNRQTPDFFLSDLDRKNFKTKKSFEESMQNILQNFKDKLHGANPSILWSGGGYHFLQPMCADVLLEMESVFMEFVEPSRKLMKYAEKIMTDNKGDPSHCNTVSFNNCMIRVPGSYNSKYVQFNDMRKVVNISPESEVKIVQSWNGYRPNIKWLLNGYWIYLIQERNNEALKTMQDEQKWLRFESKYRISNKQQISSNNIDWIESLYTKCLDDFRKYCIWRIFTPYFRNVKKLSRSEVFNLVMHWLDKCGSECRRLDFNPRQKINESLDRVRKYFPVSIDKLKVENELLYLLLKRECIMSENVSTSNMYARG
jgi:hypothetical protein